MTKLIVFDWDDVFTTGATEGYFKTYHKTMEELGINLSPEEERKRIVAKWGGTLEAELGSLLQENPELVPEAVKRYNEVLFGNTFVDSLSMVEGTPEFLERLSQDYTLAVATGANPQVIREKIMPKFGIPNLFKQIMSVYDVPSSDMGKPHPYMLETVLKTQGFKPEEAVFVGDAENDVQMARAAGVTPIVVLTGHLNEEKARGLGVNLIVPNVTNIENVLPQITTPEGRVKTHREKI